MALDYWLKNIQILIWRNKNKYFLCDTPATSQKDSSVVIITIIMFSGRVKHFDMWKKMKKICTILKGFSLLSQLPSV